MDRLQENDGFKEFKLNHPIDFMRFTLFYRGPLHAASRKETRAEEKQVLRRAFHKQLADLWFTHPAFGSGVGNIMDQWLQISDENQIANRPGNMIRAYDYGAFRFVPLVTNGLKLRCELDILFLRKEPPGYIFDGETGDVDNRLKVLFDALRMPKASDKELPAIDRPREGERPFFCLLEDDKLITCFNVETERLLSKQMETDSEVELLIRVAVKTVVLTQFNIGLGGD